MGRTCKRTTLVPSPRIPQGVHGLVLWVIEAAPPLRDDLSDPSIIVYMRELFLTAMVVCNDCAPSQRPSASWVSTTERDDSDTWGLAEAPRCRPCTIASCR